MPAVDAVQERPRPRYSAWAPLPIAALVAAAALVSLLDPAGIHAIDATGPVGVGRAWFELLVVAPALGAAGVFALRGSRRARLVAGALLLHAASVSATLAIAMDGGALFLVECAVLGASAFALIDLHAALRDDRAWSWFDERAPLRAAAVALLAVAG
ncbi:MAG: hypothetical protein KIT31_40775, partial [Deltaproteobacteria bacterium]|nr:hypothetical protein [Deltaproteobacteria bacterium]